MCGGAAPVLAVGLSLKASGTDLGTWAPPLVMRFAPRIDPLAAVSLLVIAGALGVAPAMFTRARPGASYATGLYVLALVLGLALNLGHDGTRGWDAVFATGPHGSFEGGFEYLPGLPLLDHGIGYFLAHFGTLIAGSTTHVKGNPPGPLIAMHLLGVHTAAGLAALSVALGSACAPLAYALGRTLGDEERARVAGLLTAFAPSMLLFGVSSVDYAFAAVGMLAAWLLVRGGWEGVIAGAAVAALGTFLSWLLFAMPAVAAVVVWRREGLTRALLAGLACAVAVVALNGVLAIAYGYDPFGALSATHAAYVHGIAMRRPYAFWLFGSPAAWLLMLGLPVAWLSLRALLEGDEVALALWLLIAAASVLGLTKAETERIWLPFAPLACLAAARVLPPARVRAVLWVLAAQALAVELLFFTIW